ncbi:protein ALTERED PHOSPHATE STARVATION RESPONSE 1-like [Zingiber officinale]|uniref:protein ALTERED PHOSPHATE STARVATION RESPONSE 1-like n=1 Tax=Zingiber officinale TaxID=94328 RepID=UPI001C4C0D49|nr:protein ALTERED PHOSPHATE STARVATION RESPONSE 1-like [Zingiber officinale]
MGCSESKVKQQKAVALCRGRADLLAAAIRHRDALAAAHADYSRSLFSFSSSLHRLLRSPSSSPVIPIHLPTLSKPEPFPPLKQPVSSAPRHSYSSSHIKFLPSDSDDFDDDDSPLHSGGSSPLHCLDHHYETVFCARSQPPPVPSISGSQQSQRYETVQVSSFDAAYPSYEESYRCFSRNYDSVNEFFCLSSPILAMPPSDTTEASAVGRSSSSTVPPPPPPLTTSALDFLNPFETSEAYKSHFYTPSWSSRGEREEEGIPDLEEEEVQEVVEEAYGQNPVAFSHVECSPATTYNCREEVVDKNVIEDRPEKSQMEQNDVTEKMVIFHETTGEIKAQFEKAWQSAAELSKLLELGKHQYHPKHSLYQVSSRAINATPPRLSYGVLDFDADKVTDSRSLASTLQKLYIWERKLYHEVKSEEKMRLLLRRRHEELRCLVDKGAEAHKVDSTRTVIKKLSTKIRIAIQVVHSISKKINRLRDEELQPRTTELVRGLARMWNILLKCHQMQCKEISETKRLGLVVSAGGLSTNHADEIMQLELEMIKWTCSFSSWINAQNNFVKALNAWLVLYLNCEYKLDATIDRVPPHSPRRMGAPPVFIIYSCWSQVMDRTSRSEVLESMQSLTAATHRQWVHQNVEQRESMAEIKDMHKWLRTLKKNQKNRDKEVSSLLDKKLALAPTYTALCNIDEESRVDSGLKRMLEIMKDFAASSVKAYQELSELCEEHRIN